jgi:hypothetical protein
MDELLKKLRKEINKTRASENSFEEWREGRRNDMKKQMEILENHDGEVPEVLIENTEHVLKILEDEERAREIYEKGQVLPGA